MLGRDIS
jgi:hypothetical protein